MIFYRIEVADLHAHQFRVTVRVARPAANQRFSLPVWIPGSYMVREFARHLSHIEARQGERRLAVRQIDKASWDVGCTGTTTLEISYLVYAFDTSVRAAYLDANRGFFNGTSTFVRIEGREAETQQLEIRGLPRGWQTATALPPSAAASGASSGRFEAADYDALVDHPVELGTFWRGQFTACGVPHEFIVAGALPGFDGERLLADARAICEAQITFWHGRKKPCIDRYVFLLNAVDDGYGGLEHRASTALIAARRDLPRVGRKDLTDGYVTLLGLISHEYFHTWNVKRLRPSDLASIDYTRENYTELLWFFEGFTSYYDDLMLLRTERIDAARYLRLVGKTVGAVLATPGRRLQSAAQASFDAWVKYYRSEENTPNATVSYYTKGALIALSLDLTLRAEGRGTLDEVMRNLWARSAGGPVTEADIGQALREVGGRSYDNEISVWVHGTEDLPVLALLDRFGIGTRSEAGTLAQRLGVRVSESALTGVQVKGVSRGGAAERAGLAAGDEVIAADAWRLRRLEDIAALAAPGATVDLLVSRDQRMMNLRLELKQESKDAGGVTLSLADKPPKTALALRRAWLGQ